MICFHVNDICSVVKRICLHEKKTKKTTTVNCHRKFSQQIAPTNSCGKLPQQIILANSQEKFSRMIDFDKF